MKFKVQITEPVFTASDRSYLKLDYDTNEPITDEEGMNTYQSRVMTTSNGKVETLDVNVKGKEDPLAKLPPMTPITLVDPEINFGVFNGKKYYSISASAIRKA